MYMDDIKMIAKKKKEWETLLHVVTIHRDDIGMEFGREKCPMLIINSRKQQMTEGIELPNQEKIRTLKEKETSKY